MVFKMGRIAWIILCVSMAGSVSAEAQRITDKETFLNIVVDKTLARPFVSLQVSPDGKIDGNGVGRKVTGDWSWNDGYFCRTMFWGSRELSYNCQSVDKVGDKLRFTADKGAGMTADFSLR